MFSQAFATGRKKECSGRYFSPRFLTHDDYFMCSSIYPRAHRVQSLTCSGDRPQKINWTVCRINSLSGFLIARNPETPESRKMYIAELILQAPSVRAITFPEFPIKLAAAIENSPLRPWKRFPQIFYSWFQNLSNWKQSKLFANYQKGAELQPHISIAVGNSTGFEKRTKFCFSQKSWQPRCSLINRVATTTLLSNQSRSYESCPCIMMSTFLTSICTENQFSTPTVKLIKKSLVNERQAVGECEFFGREGRERNEMCLVIK